MEFRDYYQTLGLARDATQDDIKRAYRKLARKYAGSSFADFPAADPHGCQARTEIAALVEGNFIGRVVFLVMSAAATEIDA